MNARAIVFTGVNQVELRSVQVPQPGPGEVLLEALYTIVSPGTELRCLAGKQAGVTFPFIPGYAFAGRVIACGDGVKLPEGILAYCSGTSKADIACAWGGHISLAVQSEKNVYPLPEGVDPLWGAAAHLAAIAYRGVRLSRPQPHEMVAVIGLGTIGALSARLYAASGARVLAADLSPFRVSVARQAGLEAFVPQGDLATSFRQILPDGADVVVDATGHPAVLPQAIAIARDKPWDDSSDPGPRLVVQGSYAGDFSVPYQAAFLKELTFFLPRDAQPRDIRAVLDLMGRGKLRLDGIISTVHGPETAAEVYTALRDPQAGLITAAFGWSSR